MNKKSLVIIDIISTLYISLPIIGVWSFILWLIKYNFWFIFVTPLLAPILMATNLFIFRIVLPPLKKGVYKVDLNKNYLSWYLNLCLVRSLKASGLEVFIMSMAWTRYLIAKALGAKFSYQIMCAINIDLCDYQLITIRSGCSLGDHVKISAHYLTPNKLILRPVYLDKDTVVPSYTKIKPGTKSQEGEVLKTIDKG